MPAKKEVSDPKKESLKYQLDIIAGLAVLFAHK
jgi:hypothetical protein